MTDLDIAVEAARAGAAVIARAWGLAIAAEWKGDANPVTAVDEEAEAAIVEVIRGLRAEDSVLAEESGGAGWERNRVWIIDPLDGTVNFIHRIPQVAVSVSLWIDGAPSVATIIDVTRQEHFTATAGGGAFLDGAAITVSAQGNLGESLIATGFPYDRNIHGHRYATILGEVLTRAQGIRRFGSAALDLAWVACGRYEGYWEFGIQPWDAAAGVLLTTESGGKVTNLAGDPHRLDDSTIVATNGRIHDDLIAAVVRG